MFRTASVAALGASAVFGAYSLAVPSQNASCKANEKRAAVCILHPDGGSGVSGVVQFSQESESGPVTIKADLQGLKPGKHGFHIHMWGDLREGCKTAGPHYNPFGRTHGGPNDTQRHVGDLGNIIAGADGVGTLTLSDKMVKLSGPESVVGRSCVVHADEDDLGRGGHDDSLTTGHAGARVACGVIGLADAK